MNYKMEVKTMILKCNNEKVVNLVKYFETLDFADKLRLSIDMLESYHVKVKNDKILEILKKLLCAIDESYNKTKFLNLLNYKHLLMTSAQVMELTEKEQEIFIFEILFNIYILIKLTL
jgi:hypothetical protein